MNSDDDAASLLTLNSKILCSLFSTDLSSFSVSPGCVSKALAHLKLKKSDGTQLHSNHFICAATSLLVPLSKLFTAMLRHGMSPSLSETVFYAL